MDEVKNIVNKQLKSSKYSLSSHIAMLYAVLLGDNDSKNESSTNSNQNWGYTALTKVPYNKRQYLQPIGNNTRELLQKDFYTPHMWLNAQIEDTLDTMFDSLLVKNPKLPYGDGYVTSYNNYLFGIKERILKRIPDLTRNLLHRKASYEEMYKAINDIFDSETKNIPAAAADVYSRMEYDNTLFYFLMHEVYEFKIQTEGESCAECLSHGNKVYDIDELHDIQIPFHPNCKCKLVPADENAYSKIAEDYANDYEKLLDDLQLALDGFGMIPGFGNFFDSINAVISLFRKHYVEAGLSALSAIPLVGWFSTILKNVFKHGDEVIDGVEFVVKHGDEIADGAKNVVKHGDEIVDGAKNVVKHGDEIADGAKSIFKNGNITIEAVKSNPKAFSGKSADEIADLLKSEGYDIIIKKSEKSKSGAEIIQIKNTGGAKNITQVQVSPGGGRHGDNPYIKISTCDQGIIKIVDGSKELYKSNAVENSTIIFTN